MLGSDQLGHDHRAPLSDRLCRYCGPQRFGIAKVVQHGAVRHAHVCADPASADRGRIVAPKGKPGRKDLTLDALPVCAVVIHG